MINLFNSSVKDQSYSFGEDQNDFMSRIVDSDFSNCTFYLHDPDFLFMMRSVFKTSVFKTARKATRLFWPGCFFSLCRFEGQFYDTRFGISGDDLDDRNNQAGLENCDFSNASLHLCSFYNCDPTTLMFPRWPHITVLHPRKNAGDWKNIPFPSGFKVFQDVITYSENSKAATIHWPTYAQEENDTTDPESIRQLLVGKDYIVM